MSWRAPNDEFHLLKHELKKCICAYYFLFSSPLRDKLVSLHNIRVPSLTLSYRAEMSQLCADPKMEAKADWTGKGAAFPWEEVAAEQVGYPGLGGLMSLVVGLSQPPGLEA